MDRIPRLQATCLAYETELITPDGARPIGSLVGRTTLLVPKKQSARVPHRSKTDQEREGVRLGIAFGRFPDTCPVAATRAWLEVLDAHDTLPPLFRALGKGRRLLPARLSDKRVALIVKRAVAAAGLDPAQFAGHSLRSGMATSAAAGGAQERDIMRHTRHKSAGMVRRYIREGELFHAGNATRFTGL